LNRAAEAIHAVWDRDDERRGASARKHRDM
jgi:hypothetical protein